MDELTPIDGPWHVEHATRPPPSPPEPAPGGFAASLTPRGRLRGKVPRRLVAHIKERVVADHTVVELSAGTGVLTGALHRAGCRVVAVEADGASAAQIRRAVPGVDVIRADPSAIPLRSGVVDTLVLHWSLTDAEVERLFSRIGHEIGMTANVILLRRSTAAGGTERSHLLPQGVGRRINSVLADERYGESLDELDLTMWVWTTTPDT